MRKWLFREWAFSLRAIARYALLCGAWINEYNHYFEFDWTRATHRRYNIYTSIFFSMLSFYSEYIRESQYERIVLARRLTLSQRTRGIRLQISKFRDDECWLIVLKMRVVIPIQNDHFRSINSRNAFILTTLAQTLFPEKETWKTEFLPRSSHDRHCCG